MFTMVMSRPDPFRIWSRLVKVCQDGNAGCCLRLDGAVSPDSHQAGIKFHALTPSLWWLPRLTCPVPSYAMHSTSPQWSRCHIEQEDVGVETIELVDDRVIRPAGTAQRFPLCCIAATLVV